MNKKTIMNEIKLLEEMIRHQEAKALKLAREIIPGISPEDIMNAQDFPELERNGQFNFEDGILAGLKSALMAIKGSRNLL